MTTQVISISPAGEVSGLQVKPGKGFDLRVLGKAQIERASEVLFSERHQQWYVKIVKGKYSGKCISYEWWCCATGQEPQDILNRPPIAFFDEYDDAVKAEIAVLDHVRLNEGPSALA